MLGYPTFAEVTIAEVVGTGMDVLSFDAPVLSNVVMNAPLTGTAQLSLTGLNFHQASHTITIIINRQPVTLIIGL